MPGFLSALSFPWHPAPFIPASLTGPFQGAFEAVHSWAELLLGLGALQPLLPSGDVLCSETMTHKLQEVLGMLSARWKKINGQKSCLVKKKNTSNDCKVPGWKHLLLHGEVGPWFSRTAESSMASRAKQFVRGSQGLLHFLELASLDLCQVLWTLTHLLGFLTQTSLLKMLLRICFLPSSLNYPYSSVSLVSASTEKGSSWWSQNPCSLMKAIL